MITIRKDENGNLIPPTLVLCNRNGHKLGTICPIENFEITPDFRQTNEFSFDVYKYADNVICHLWDKIIGLKVIYIPEYNEYFEIDVSLLDESETKKTVIGKNRGIAELSQTMLYDIEINTEADISRDDYDSEHPCKIFDEDNPKISLLHRVLSKAPHYSIGHVDVTLASMVRSFSINEKSIYDFLNGELSEELGCLVLVDSVSRTVSLFDLENYCADCKRRYEEHIKTCPYCGSKNVEMGYGDDTTIYISKHNLSSSVRVETNKDSIKNTFKVQGGDEQMDAAIVACNPNGTAYINHYNKETLNDMSEELRNKLSQYDTLYESKLETYKDTMKKIYDAIDQILYLTSGMMPSIETDTNTVETELKQIEKGLKKGISVQKLSSASKTTIDSAIKAIIPAYIDNGFKAEIESSAYDETSYVWSGKIKVINTSDQEIYAISSTNINVSVDENFESYTKQKLEKVLAKVDLKEDKEEDWTKYALTPLKSFSDAYNSCLDVLIKQNMGSSSSEFYESFYLKYYNRKIHVDEEIKKREIQIQEQEKIRDDNASIRDVIQKELSIEEFLGDELYAELCAYRREDTYKNDNYISDGLDTTQIFDMAERLLEVANKELFKSGELQYTLSATIGKLIAMDEFASIIPKFKPGNWIRFEADDIIYKLRLMSYTIKGKNDEDMPVTISNAIRYIDGISDLQSIINDAKSIATSYQGVKKQAEKGEVANQTFEQLQKDSLNTALIQIKNNNDEEVTYDNHGLSCKSYDDITQTYDPEEVKVTHNIIAFTDDGWKSVKQAIGKHQYVLGGKRYEGYGVNSDFVISGTVIAGDIYSANYNDEEHTGTRFNLNDGTFSLADEKMKFNGDSLTLKDITIDWDTTNTPPVDEDVLEKIDSLGFTSIGGNYVISPKIYGGYLDIKNHNDGRSVTIDPTEMTGKGNIFQITNRYGNATLYADSYGNTVLKGTIYAYAGEFSGAIKGGTISIGNNFKVDSSGNMIANNMTLKGGTIGAWEFGDYDFYYNNADKSFGLGAYGYTNALWAGATFENRNSAPFRVSHEGKLIANNADIRGILTNEHEEHSQYWDGTPIYKKRTTSITDGTINFSAFYKYGTYIENGEASIKYDLIHPGDEAGFNGLEINTHDLKINLANTFSKSFFSLHGSNGDLFDYDSRYGFYLFGGIMFGRYGRKINDIMFGTSVINVNGTSALIMSQANMWDYKIFADSSILLISNGDGIASSMHFDAATYQYTDGKKCGWFATFAGGITGNVRINWVLISFQHYE